MFLAAYCWWTCEVDESPRQNHWCCYTIRSFQDWYGQPDPILVCALLPGSRGTAILVAPLCSESRGSSGNTSVTESSSVSMFRHVSALPPASQQGPGAISTQHRWPLFVISAGGKERSCSSMLLIPVKIKHGSQRNQRSR